MTRSFYRSAVATAVGALTLGFFAPAAQADIVFYDGAGGVQPDENVLLSSNQPLGPAGIITGTTNQPLGPAGIITGTTNQSNTLITFTQPTASEPLSVNSNGQARIVANDNLFTSLRTSVASGTTFSLFEANPNFLAGGTLFTVRVTEDNGQVSNRNFVSGNGQNFFGVQAIAGQRISFIDILGPTNSIQDVRQIRIGGISSSVTPNAVPEPSEWLAMGMAATSVGGLMLRARRRNSRRAAV
ncbi:MAG: PEP-CTERM sorting domain-containing protein [Armatimonadota bacterium]